MSPAQPSVGKVCIETGCTGCGICVALCPEVFAMSGGQCVVRAGADDPMVLRRMSRQLRIAAHECPSAVIRCLADAADRATLTDGAASETAPPIPRRQLLTAGAGWAALGASGVLAGLAAQRFSFPNVTDEGDPRVSVGPLDRYAPLPPGSVVSDHARESVFISRTERGIVALSPTCTHLGCILNWQESERQFRCPCHGSAFDCEGVNLEGPAPRPMEHYSIAVRQGKVIVDRGRRFLQERDEWGQPGSIVLL